MQRAQEMSSSTVVIILPSKKERLTFLLCTRCSLLVTFYSLLPACCFSTRYSLLVISYFLLVASYFLLVNRYFLLVTRYFSARYLLLSYIFLVTILLVLFLLLTFYYFINTFQFCKTLNISVFIFARSAQLAYLPWLANELLYIMPPDCLIRSVLFLEFRSSSESWRCAWILAKWITRGLAIMEVWMLRAFQVIGKLYCHRYPYRVR